MKLLDFSLDPNNSELCQKGVKMLRFVYVFSHDILFLGFVLKNIAVLSQIK